MKAAANPLETDLQTQVNILQSESVLGQVIAKLDLGTKLAAEKDKGRLSAWRKALHLPESKPASTVEDILPLVARQPEGSHASQHAPGRRSSTIPPTRFWPPHIANTLTAEFIRQNLESRWQTTQKTGEWLTGQMEDVRIKLEKSEEQLQAYARAAGLHVHLGKG